MKEATDLLKEPFINLSTEKPELFAFFILLFIVIVAAGYTHYKRSLMKAKMDAEHQQRKDEMEKAREKRESDMLNKMMTHHQEINNRISESMEQLTAVVGINTNAIGKYTDLNKTQYNSIECKLDVIHDGVHDVKKDLAIIKTKLGDKNV